MNMEWQPIEAAPKTGDCILLWRGRSRAEIGYWNDQKYHSNPNPYWAAVGSLGVTYDRDSPPTHWMPLPPSPAQQGGGQG